MSNNTQPPWNRAPEGATHAEWAGWWMWYRTGTGNGIQFWDVTNNAWCTCIYPPGTLIPRPQPEHSHEVTPQWRGPQDGLPPVQNEPYKFRIARKEEWVDVLAHHDGKAVVAFHNDDGTYSYTAMRADEFPKSDRDRAIDAAVKEYAESNLSDYFVTAAGTIKQIAGLWYDAGLLREVG